MRRASGVNGLQHAPGGLASSPSFVPASFPFTLSLYTTPPSHDTTIDKFERISVGRLHVLRAVEAAVARGQRDDDLQQIVRRTQDKYLPLHSNESAAAFDVEDERTNDAASHWMLRLAFAGTVENCRWFVAQEAALFKARYSMCSVREKGEFVRSVQLPYGQCSDEERQLLHDDLAGSTAHSIRPVDDEHFIKVPWTHVTDLVAKRQVLLYKGFAYVPSTDLYSVIYNRFKDQLEADMDRMHRLMLAHPIEERVRHLLDQIRNISNVECEQASRTSRKDELTASDIESFSVHFPPCMASMYRYLKTDRHLKYNGRQQFGLFLKGIGVPFNEALLFWKRSFAKISDDEFNKNYAYNVRHNYGLEGKRANYGCMGCKQIIGTASSPSDHSGCPFKTHNTDQLAALLGSMRSLSDTQIGEVVETAKSGGHHYQAACSRFLDMSLNKADSEPIVTPTFFYEASLARASSTKK